MPTALVTGGSRGIGRAIAAELSRTHRVIATYKGNREAAESLQKETGCEIAQCDNSSAVDRANLIRHARERFGTLDLLVNNAGITQRERNDILEASEESFDELIGTNLKGPHFLTQAVARWILETKPLETKPVAGRIVFVTSISAYAGSLNRAEYCMSKAALSMSVALYASRLAPEGIGVFELRPGIIRTDMISKVEKLYDEKIAGGLLPQRRMGEPADVARAVRAIAEGYLDYCAGQILDVDGGFHLRTL